MNYDKLLGQTIKPINPCGGVFEKLILLAIHWHIKVLQK